MSKLKARPRAKSEMVEQKYQDNRMFPEIKAAIMSMAKRKSKLPHISQYMSKALEILDDF